MKTSRERLATRLSSYWRMERACVFLFPPIGFAAARPDSMSSAIVLMLSLAACCLTLWIGAVYWRAALGIVRGDETGMTDALHLADSCRPPCLGITLVSLLVSTLHAYAGDGGVAAYAACGFSVLAALEYLNYYHVQLQNFDHLPTFLRFLRTRRLPRSHLAKALGVYRARERGRGSETIG